MKIDYPADLPISGKHAEIVSAIKENSVVIISGSTGSGKTTQIPKMCLEAGFGKQKKIGCTQPRRVAAISVAQRISDELKVSYGSLVGSKIRFNDKTSKNTRIQVMTDGILLQEFQSDSKLSNYDVLIIDEAHERSLNIDFILGFLKNLIEERLDLKVVITSATIDTQKFSNAFLKAPIIEVSGTLHPIEVDYRPVDNERQDL
jgi:ATP-dependent helicase HrpA